MANKAFEGLKVIEYANGIGTPYSAKLLADLGADIIKIEKPGKGDSARHLGPFYGGEPDKEKSCIFLYVNTNKKSITLDLEKEEGIEVFKDLVKDADILLMDGLTEEFEGLGIGYGDLEKINPRLVVAVVSPYGSTGPYKNYKANPLNISHMSGSASYYPQGSLDINLPPVAIAANFEQYDVGTVSLIGVLAALYYRNKTGKGQLMELSALEAAFQIGNTENTIYAVYNEVAGRTGQRLRMQASIIAKCKDGYVCPFLVQPFEFNNLAKLIGKDEWLEETWYQNFLERIERIDEVAEALHDWLKDKTKDEITELAQKGRVPIGPVYTVEELVESEQFKARNYFTEITHPVCGTMKFPGRQFILSETPFAYDNAAPLLGEHNDYVYKEVLGYKEEYIDQLKTSGVI